MNNIQLRYYQTNARIWGNQQLNASRNALIVMPCGTGKSLTMAMIAYDRIRMGEKIIVVVPQNIIQEQLLIAFDFLDPGYINDEGIKGRNKNVYIAMAPSLNNILHLLPEDFIRSMGTIITDETQFSSANTWRNIYNIFCHSRRLGLTATPYRMDNQPLGEFYEVMYEAIKQSEAIKQGFLCKPITIIPDEYKDFIFKDLKKINIEEQREHLKERTIIGDMIKEYNIRFNGQPCIIPATTLEHAEQIKEMYNRSGWTAVTMSGGTALWERKKIIKGIKQEKINQLITVGVGIYGMDIPELMGIIWMRLTGSLTIWNQFNGRPARIRKGKDKFLMIDPIGNCVLHGFPDIDRHYSLHANYKPEPEVLAPEMKLCPQCGVMNAKINQLCHICGFDFINDIIESQRKRKLPVMVDGKLIVLDGEELAIRKEKIQEGLKEQRKQQAEKDDKQPQQEPKIITRQEKIQLLKDGLSGKKDLFSRAVKEWL